MPVGTRMHMCCLSGGLRVHVAAKSLLQKAICFFLWRKLWNEYQKELKFLFCTRKWAQAHSVCEQSLMPLGHIACPMHTAPNFQGKHNRSKELWLPQTDSVWLDQLYAINICCVLYSSDLLYSGCAATPC